MGWLSRWWGGQSGEQGSVPPAETARAPAAPAGSPSEPPSSGQGPEEPVEESLTGWLLDLPVRPSPQSPDDAERRHLDLIDRLLAQPSLPHDMLPRAPEVVPQLVAVLREPELPVPAMAERIAKDLVLAAEVLRLANGSLFAGRAGPVEDLRQAIQRLGSVGVQMAIARVVLRPLYEMAPGTLAARAAPRLWGRADVLSRHCAQAVRQQGLAPFEGYLGGLLHGTGWTVLLHALQKGGVAGAQLLSPEAALAMAQRAHRLFGLAAKDWGITPAFTAFADDALRRPLEHSRDPIAQVLRQVEPLCLAELKGCAPARQ